MEGIGNPGALAGQAGNEYLWMKAHAAISTGDVVFIAAGDAGLASVAIPSAKVGRCAVAVHDVASGSMGLFCVRGICKAKVYVDGTGTSATTAGKALECDTSFAGKFEQAAGGPSGALVSDQVQFGVILTAGTDSTADSVVWVYGEVCVSTS